MRIYIGADHNGFELKDHLTKILKQLGHDVEDSGDLSFDQNDDFPHYAGKVATAVLGDRDSDARGILICGSGQGMAMAANRFKGIRAALCWNKEEAYSSRNDDDSNVLCISSKYMTTDEAETVLMTWLNTAFAGAPRYKRRIKELDELG